MKSHPLIEQVEKKGAYAAVLCRFVCGFDEGTHKMGGITARMHSAIFVHVQEVMKGLVPVAAQMESKCNSMTCEGNI